MINKLQDNQHLKDFAQFLASKSLGSEHYLSVNMLHQAQLYFDTDIEKKNIQERTTQDSESQLIFMDHVNILVQKLRQKKTLDVLLTSVNDENGYSCIDATTLKNMISKSIEGPVEKEIKNELPNFDLREVCT